MEQITKRRMKVFKKSGYCIIIDCLAKVKRDLTLQLDIRNQAIPSCKIYYY